MSEDLPAPIQPHDIEAIKAELAKSGASRGRRIFDKFLMAAIGSIPWVVGFLSAAASIPGDEGALRTDTLQGQWLEEHQRKIELLQATLDDISDRFEKLGPAVDERVQSPAYLSLVRQAFRAWDNAETDEKRRYAANLLSNAAGTRLCSDDVLRLFISWIDTYHEAHFAVIREIFKHPGITRYDIWVEIYGETEREDSAEADLYRLLIHELNVGRVLRQDRATNAAGQFLRKKPVRRKGIAPTTMESAFEETKPYVLTELGKQFVHYTMNEVVPRIGSTPQ